jgi:hypothetical protein
MVYDLRYTGKIIEIERYEAIASELAGQESEDFPEIDFREQIANELTRDELIERLCEMHKHYTEMREEWFNVVQLRDQPDKATADTCNCTGRLEFTMENNIIWCNKCRKRFML